MRVQVRLKTFSLLGCGFAPFVGLFRPCCVTAGATRGQGGHHCFADVMNSVVALLSSRIRLSAPLAVRHLVLSVVVAGLSATLVIGVWFPPPFAEISGGMSLFLVMTAVDVVCGPTLTLLLLHPGKSRRALAVDLALIAALQFSALGYGVYTLSEARPIAVVFEVDRFRVVSYADLDASHPERFPEWVRPWGFEGPRLLGVRAAKSAQEKFESLNASLQGLEPGQRPEWWQDYAINAQEVKQRGKPLELLLATHPNEKQRLLSAAEQAASRPLKDETQNPKDLLWVPMVSRRSMDWVVFVDPLSARIRGYLHVDGFGG